MTDDSKAKKNALKSLWPTSRQILCNFHMAQADLFMIIKMELNYQIDEKISKSEIYKFIYFKSNNLFYRL